MEHPEEQYYKLNRFLLRFSGLWPYQSARDAFIMRTIITILILSSLFVQITSAFKSEITIDYLFDMIPWFVPTLGTLTHLYARIIHINKLKELFDCIWNDWALQKTEDEMKIMHKHAGTSRSLMIYFSRKGNTRFRFTYRRKKPPLSVRLRLHYCI
ncbi:uncharacterized protein LOC116843901 [Odontomachus brunneus]|uniref:uncharacterized protein LOC116843901 n=1 Tax=Odontomachus brunneus TaxID=486640 RepID=UPI0013F26724|nr:uncharacterized protein LOC116843901 [Odontomachus brunneus]